MKFRIAAAAALIICSLYGCGNGRDTTSSLYTPAPITPRPTFDTSKYRTKEEITAKQDKSFVIKEDEGVSVGPYQDRSNEYTLITPSPSPTPAMRNLAMEQLPSQDKVPFSINTQKGSSVSNNNNIVWTPQSSGNSSSVAVVYTPAPESTPAPVLTPRPSYAVPAGFSSKDYPYRIYSNNGSTYLGKVTTNTEDPESIWNPNGEYGSSTSTTSIYNTYGIYGSKNSMFSAFNDYATAPPKIFDNSGNFVGYLSSNLIHTNGIAPDGLKAYAEKNGF